METEPPETAGVVWYQWYQPVVPASGTSGTSDQSAKWNEVVLQPGDALILPTYWFHSIIGLTHENAQCNAWSAATVTYKATIQACTDGFEQETQLLSATGQAIPS
jgi:hypothetical protein